jgi:hydrogenase nickel incorporation protein HypA/HybF
MHEAGIAASILEICNDEAGKHGGGAIRSVRLRLGGLAGVVPEALEFAFDALKGETRAAGAVLDIERVPLAARCPSCKWSGEPEGDICLFCPSCDAPLEIISGRELEVVYIDIEETTECNVP